jgi:hypothetical protein
MFFSPAAILFIPPALTRYLQGHPFNKWDHIYSYHAARNMTSEGSHTYTYVVPLLVLQDENRTLLRSQAGKPADQRLNYLFRSQALKPRVEEQRNGPNATVLQRNL